MFTKEGLKYLAKKQQQEADNATEIVTLSSDDECTTNDTAPLASPFTTLAVSKKWQAKVKVLEEQCPPPFPSICHILQKGKWNSLNLFHSYSYQNSCIF